MYRPRSSLALMTQAPTSLNLSSTWFSSKLLARPARKVLGGSDSTFGKRKRSVPRVRPTVDATSAAQATPIHVINVRRSAPLAAGLAGAGLGGAGGGLGGAGGVAVTAVAGGAGGG